MRDRRTPKPGRWPRGRWTLVVALALAAATTAQNGSLAPTASAETAPPGYAPQQVFAVGNGPSSVVMTDVNGDGKADIVVANRDDNTVGVLLNTTAPGATTPSFAAQQVFAVGALPASVATADVNGDGKPDILVVNTNDKTVGVLVNTTAPADANPGFAAQQVFAVGGAPSALAVDDLNGDGKPDILVANRDDKTVGVLLNTTAPGAPDPTFTAQQAFGVGALPSSVALSDLNGDGKPDIIVANGDDKTVGVLLNTTEPGATAAAFTAHEVFAVGNAPGSVGAGDLNGDGKPDLVVANSGDKTVGVLLNTTAPGAMTPAFAPQQTFAAGDGVRSVVVMDVSGDLASDVVVANAGDNTVGVLVNVTEPGGPVAAFDAQQAFAVGGSPASVTLGDVNGDEKLDLCVANGGDRTVGVLLNAPPPPPTP